MPLEINASSLFKPHLQVRIESSHFLIRTIHSQRDLMDVLKLRARCFPLKKLEPDRFDLDADHLIVEDLVQGKICGAYRVACSDFTDNFESAHDFYLENFLCLPDKKLELAWACVDPEYRNQQVISLLWRGLAQIFRQIEPRYVFGLTSIGTQQVSNLDEFCRFLENQKPMDKSLQIQPQKSKSAGWLSGSRSSTEPSRFSMRKIPGLLRIYLLAGALICAQPAFDPEINVYDFFTVLDLDQCAEKVLNHFEL